MTSSQYQKLLLLVFLLWQICIVVWTWFVGFPRETYFSLLNTPYGSNVTRNFWHPSFLTFFVGGPWKFKKFLQKFKIWHFTNSKTRSCLPCSVKTLKIQFNIQNLRLIASRNPNKAGVFGSSFFRGRGGGGVIFQEELIQYQYNFIQPYQYNFIQLYTTWEIPMEFSGKMLLMIIWKATKNGLSLSLENTFLEKSKGGGVKLISPAFLGLI